MKKVILNSTIVILISLIVLFIPIPNLDIIQHRALVIFVGAVFLWMLEPIPVYVTSMLIVFFSLIFLSDKGLDIFTSDIKDKVLSYKDVYNAFSQPIIFLFLGGFFIAGAAEKYSLDKNLARVILKPFGSRSDIVMLGAMIITALFSMIMSNTATTAMMMTTMLPILKKFSDDDKGKVAFTLSIPFAANVGGKGTPIGTPPNGIALAKLSPENSISFAEWMLFSVPYMVVLLLITWFLLIKIYPFKQKNIDIAMKGKFDKSPKAIVLYVTFIVTVLLWMFGENLGLNSYTVAFIPIIVFLVTGVIDKKDLRNIEWSVLWLMSGAFALGGIIENTGLGASIIKSIPFEIIDPFLIIVLSGIIACLFGTFMSQTAATSLLMPILIILPNELESLKAIGGEKMMVITVAYTASLAMALPTSTPPNAIAHATGLVKTKEMILPGTLISIIGLILSYGMILLLKNIGFI